ncbi:MAG: hypothetical protein ACOYJW_02735 [Candidatus Omnitrophota bacterium]|jgi:hypothetical protein
MKHSIKNWFERIPINLRAAAGLLGLLFVFYPDLFLVKAAPLTGDHLEQHYPWAMLLWKSLRQGSLPFWTPLIQCGFPIAAEGQIGVFYLPNILLSLLLPFHWAYSYANLVHFLIAGWGTYAYLRKMKLMPSSAFIGAFIYLFGTAYGGAYYNITSLKTLAWFPWMLMIFERMLSVVRLWHVLVLAVLASLMILAGYLQVAALGFAILLVYALIRIWFFADGVMSAVGKCKLLVILGLSIAIGVLISAPQLWLTFQLAIQSNRAVTSENYTYVGSLSPLAFATLVFSVVQGYCRGNSFYMGIFSIFLLIAAGYTRQDSVEHRIFRLWLWMTVISLLLALGQLSPLYVAFVKIFRFYAFRTPAKFLVFACFGLSVISAIGFQTLWRASVFPVGIIKKAARGFYMTIGVACAGWAGAYAIFSWGRTLLIHAGDWFILNFIYQKAGHPHSLENYRVRLGDYLDRFAGTLALQDDWAKMSLIPVILGLILTFFLTHAKKCHRKWLVVGVLFLAFDLYAVSFRDIKADFGSYRDLDKIFDADKELYSSLKNIRGRLFGFRNQAETIPLTPNVNMLHEIEDVGAYSPLVLSRYYETIGRLGNVNDSNQCLTPDSGFVLERFNLLSFLDVDMVLSSRWLQHESLQLVATDDRKRWFLYKNTQSHARAYFVTDCEFTGNWAAIKNKLMAPGFDPAKKIFFEENEKTKIQTGLRPTTAVPISRLERLKHTADLEQWRLKTTGPGFFVLSNMMYPGWEATINGKSVPVLKAFGLFQAVYISEPGEYEVEFHFRPFVFWEVSEL